MMSCDDTLVHSRIAKKVGSDANSYTPPPSELLGGYRIGDATYFAGGDWTFPDGDKLVYGLKGEVVGPTRGEDAATRLTLQFPGNKGPTQCLLTNLSRTPPPAPTTSTVEEQD